jgi:IclR family acetate operon transcriptional repressor
MGSVNALEATFEVVEFLSRNGASPVKKIARAVDRPKSTLYDHLETLEHLNYVVKEGSEYRLSSRFLGIGMQARDNLRLFTLAKEEIDTLAEETGEHAALYIEENGLSSMLYTCAGENAIEITQYDGMMFPSHCGAPGKVMLAYMSEKDVDEIIERHGLPKYTENTITDRDQLFEELREIRRRGHAFERSEHLKGVRSVATPVTANDGVVGAITVYGPASRFKGEYFTSVLPEYLNEARNIIEVNYSY